MINIVIFSKNRAAQLELLLTSLKQNFAEFEDADVVVLYKATSREFDDGYSILKNEWPKVSFLDDNLAGSFRPTLVQTLSIRPDNPFTMFLVDDIVFRDSFSINDPVFNNLGSPDMLAVSLRLYDKITHCYATDTPSPLPNFTMGNVWKWSTGHGDWGYPMSVDGNVFRTFLINHLLKEVVPLFDNPNTFEAVLNHPIVKQHLPSYMCCYKEKSKLINNPANRVQDLFQNRTTGAFTAEEINESFLAGKRLRPVGSVENLENNTVHYDIEMEMVYVNNS